MGSEQGFQASKVDPEAEDRTKKAQKNRLKKLLTKPRAEDTDLFVVKTEKEKPEPREEQIPETKAPVTETEEPKDTDALPAQAEESKDQVDETEQVEDQAELLPTQTEEDIELPDVESLPSEDQVSNQTVSQKQPAVFEGYDWGDKTAETPDDWSEYDRAVDPDIVSVDLHGSEQLREIPIRNTRPINTADRPTFSEPEPQSPEPATAEQPPSTRQQLGREYQDPPATPPQSSFEDMVNKVLAPDQTSEVRYSHPPVPELAYDTTASSNEPAYATAEAQPLRPLVNQSAEQPMIKPPDNPPDQPYNRIPPPRTSPIVSANRLNVPGPNDELFDHLGIDQRSQAQEHHGLTDYGQRVAEHLSSSAPNSPSYDYNLAPITETKTEVRPQDDDHTELPEVAELVEPETEPPADHRIEHSVWHSIEVDSKTGHAVENPTFNYGQEYIREQAPEHKDEPEEEIAVASGQLAVGGITNIDMPLPQPIPFSVPLDSTQRLKKLVPDLTKLSHIELPITKLQSDFRRDIWLWIILGLVVMANIIAIAA